VPVTLKRFLALEFVFTFGIIDALFETLEVARPGIALFEPLQAIPHLQ